MRLLILGSLGPYPERIRSFIEDGHQVWYVSTEFLPAAEQIAGVAFASHVWDFADATEDAVGGVMKLIEAERIEIVYSLLNVWDGSNHVTAKLLERGSPIPVVRHYKEHYLASTEDERTCLERSAGVIFINEEAHDYFCKVYRLPRRTACLDADLLPRRYLQGSLQRKLSASDGRPHLLIAGTVTDDGGRYDYRLLIGELTNLGAHVHLYGQFRRMRSDGRMLSTPEVEAAYRALQYSAGRLHFHVPIPPVRFVEEWSCYDAGLLHMPTAEDVFLVQNLPNRYSAYIAAGVPVAVPATEMPAMRRQLESLNAAVVYESPEDLVGQLPLRAAVEGALAAREAVTFEAIYPRLMAFIRDCLN